MSTVTAFPSIGENTNIYKVGSKVKLVGDMDNATEINSSDLTRHKITTKDVVSIRRLVPDQHTPKLGQPAPPLTTANVGYQVQLEKTRIVLKPSGSAITGRNNRIKHANLSERPGGQPGGTLHSPGLVLYLLEDHTYAGGRREDKPYTTIKKGTLIQVAQWAVTASGGRATRTSYAEYDFDRMIDSVETYFVGNTRSNPIPHSKLVLLA